MPTIFQEKEQTATETPILLFDCTLSSGQVEHWSTHKVTVSGTTYDPRVLQYNIFQMQTSSDMGVDAIPKISVTRTRIRISPKSKGRPAGRARRLRSHSSSTR